MTETMTRVPEAVRPEVKYKPKFTNEQQQMIRKVREFQKEYDSLGLHELKKQIPANLRELSFTQQQEYRPQIFALAARAIELTTGMTLRDNQLALAQVLTDGQPELIDGKLSYGGKIGQLDSGEGKTIAIAAAAVYQALTEESVHIFTANDFLAKRDANALGNVYEAFGLKTGVIHEGPNAQFIYDSSLQKGDFLHLLPIGFDPKKPHKASQTVYENCNIIYGRIEDFAFDELLDNRTQDINKKRRTAMKFVKQYEKVTGEEGIRVVIDKAAAIVDEVDYIAAKGIEDMILGDPEEISDAEKGIIQKAHEVVQLFKDDQPTGDPSKGQQEFENFTIWQEGSTRHAYFSDKGIKKVMESIGLSVEDQKHLDAFFSDTIPIKLYQIFWNALQAEIIFRRDREYDVQNDHIRPLDDQGRPKEKHEFQKGLQQALQAKEGLSIVGNITTFDQTSAMAFLKGYKHFSGTSGTAEDMKDIFKLAYKKDVVVVPPHAKSRLIENDPIITQTEIENLYTIADVVKSEFVDKAQDGKFPPILICCETVEESEMLSQLFASSEFNLPHTLLNSKNLVEEDRILKNAGRMSEITITTKLAGRGTDIELGGRKPSPPTRKDGSLYPTTSREYKRYRSQRARWQQRHDEIVNMQFEIGEGEKIGGLTVIRASYGTNPPEDKQQQHRAGRNGEPGFTILITPWDAPGLKEFAHKAPKHKTKEGMQEDTETPELLSKERDRLLTMAHDKHLEKLADTLGHNIKKDAIREHAREILQTEAQKLGSNWKKYVINLAIAYTEKALARVTQDTHFVQNSPQFRKAIDEEFNGFVTLEQLRQFLHQVESERISEQPITVPIVTADVEPPTEVPVLEENPKLNFLLYSSSDQHAILNDFFSERLASTDERGFTNDVAMQKISQYLNTAWTTYIEEIEALSSTASMQQQAHENGFYRVRSYDFLETESKRKIEGLLAPTLQSLAKLFLNYRLAPFVAPSKKTQSLFPIPKFVPVLTPKS